MPGDTVRRNLVGSAGERDRVAARRAYYLSDAAALGAASLRERLEAGEELSDCLGRHRLPEGLTPDERVGYALALASRLRPALPSLLPVHGGGTRVSYVRLGMADAAYAALSPILPSATVRYAESNAEAVDAVSAGSFDFCVLPYADREGSTVRSARRLRETAGLRVVALVSVGSFDGSRLTYALCCRDFLLPAEGALRLELRLPSLQSEVLGDLLALVRAVGARTLSLESEEGRLRAALSLDATRLVGFLTAYLTLFPSGEIDTLVSDF